MSLSVKDSIHICASERCFGRVTSKRDGEDGLPMMKMLQVMYRRKQQLKITKLMHDRKVYSTLCSASHARKRREMKTLLSWSLMVFISRIQRVFGSLTGNFESIHGEQIVLGRSPCQRFRYVEAVKRGELAGS